MKETLFDNGYNRSEWTVTDPGFEAPLIGPKEPTTKNGVLYQSEESSKDAIQSNEGNKAISSQNLEYRGYEGLNYEFPGITNLYDSKNQLSALVKNAQKNQEALKVRNEKIKISKLESKNKYGW